MWEGFALAERWIEKHDGTTTQAVTWHIEANSFKPLAQETDSGMFPLIADQNGLPKAIFGTDGTAVWKPSYSLWGRLLRFRPTSSTGSLTTEIDTTLRFPGQWSDEESGLNYNVNRYYDPESGQYLSPDPIALTGGIRTQGYVCDPLKSTDPLGLASCSSDEKYLAGYTERDILATPKGERPAAKDYLDPSYVEQHLSQFDDGAARYMTKANLDKYGIAQRDGTSFVMTKTEADALLNSTRGNPAAMEEALGLPKDFLSSNQLYRIDIANPRELNLRIPSGNEAGANEFWIPGGKLPTGNLEAVIDAGGLPDTRYTSTLVDF